MRSANKPDDGADRRLPEQLPLFDPTHPPTPLGTYPTTVYRLAVPSTADGLASALNVDYLRRHGFEPAPHRVADVPALLVHGSAPRARAEWCDILSGLVGVDVALGYRSGGGALLLAVDDRAYALTFGTLGRFMVEQEKVDPTFGVRFAVRALRPDDIRQVRRRMLGASGRVDRSLVPGGQPIWRYGIDKWGEIVGQVCGRTDNPHLTACRTSGGAVKVEGGEALRIPLGVTPERLLADLREIDRVCRQESPPADLEFIEQIRPLRSTDPRQAALADELDRRLALADPPDLGVAVPGSLVADVEHVVSYRIRVPRTGRRPTLTTELDLDGILAHTTRALDGDRWNGLRNGTLTLYADAAGTEEMASTPVSRWLTAEVALDASHVLLHEGRWYEIGDRHREFLREEISRILDRPSSIALPPWTAHLPNEDAYNREAAKRDPGLVLLDKKLVRTRQHPRGIEACDLLGPNGELIHVKRASGSSPLSHLFAQGVTSYDALRYDAQARTRFRDLVRAQPGGPDLPDDFRPRTVVYAIALSAGRALTVDSLFTFAQVALYQAVKTLRAEGVDVEIVAIPPA
ncbi:TIGR04141 family sporadically distributed protein [Micromonospora sp. WMMC241]|uniref:DUF6119 family protein n=1 Tax=Micromonospora sp. WMMC241 TaxID=3015159 RepID=UPI0022B6D7B3|nr:DUF6119 family protein [Micromonospora sp. WMMC241]MCZ7437737.1 TIGR04141 family sporadically distributed protein [Micromonospora sp. WMMC241]